MAPPVSINGLGSFLDLRGSHDLVFLDSAGNLFAENPYPSESINGDFVAGIGAIIQLENPDFHIPAGLFMDNDAAYGRLFMAFSDLKTGMDIPRQFYYHLGTNRFHYNGIGVNNVNTPIADATTSTEPGDIEIGSGRYCTVLYKTRTGYISGWTIAALKFVDLFVEDRKVDITGIPISPDPNVVARILAFTQVGASSDGPYFYIPEDDFIDGLNAAPDGNGNNITKTVIEDNITTSVTLTFPDEYLIASVDVTDFIDKQPLNGDRPQKSVYFSKTTRRLIWAGEDNETYRVSEPDDPETYLGTTGFAQPGQGDKGKAICAREFRGELYFLKDNGGHLAVDTSLTPVEWRTVQRWQDSGPEGPWAIDVTNEFMAWAHRSGPYIYDGNTPTWIGYEISGNLNTYPNWDRINWDYAHKIYVLIDYENKVVKFGVPMDRSTKVNMELIVDYSRGWRNRRWSWDDVATTRAVLVKRVQVVSDDTLGFDGRIKTSQILHGSNADDGLILYEDKLNHTLNGAPFLQEARTAYTPYMSTPGIYRLNAVDAVARGQGNASFVVYGDSSPRVIALDLALEGELKDFDRKATGQNERWSILISNKNELQGWWELGRVVLWNSLIWRTRSV